MILGPASGDDLRAAQLLTGAGMALWLLTGVVPALRRRRFPLQLGLLVVWLVACGALVVRMLLRG